VLALNSQSEILKHALENKTYKGYHGCVVSNL